MFGHHDPTLEQLLADPLTKAIMTADHVCQKELEEILADIAAVVASRLYRRPPSVFRKATRFVAKCFSWRGSRYQL
jgi:transcriptional regulator of aromatic amino acid metabolism